MLKISTDGLTKVELADSSGLGTAFHLTDLDTIADVDSHWHNPSDNLQTALDAGYDQIEQPDSARQPSVPPQTDSLLNDKYFVNNQELGIGRIQMAKWAVLDHLGDNSPLELLEAVAAVAGWLNDVTGKSD